MVFMRGAKNMIKKQGFTLIELLVVVLIIGILSSVALPQYTKAVEKSRAAEVSVFMNSAKKAISIWLLQNGGLPAAKTELLKSGLLDVDLSASMDCSVAEAGTCQSKNYSYAVFCNSSKCSVYWYRRNYDSSDYYKGYVYTPDGNSWTGYCGYESDLGKSVCESLAHLATGEFISENL